MNSAANPVIYSIFNAEFREAFRKILSECYCRNKTDEFGYNCKRYANSGSSYNMNNVSSVEQTAPEAASLNSQL